MLMTHAYYAFGVTLLMLCYNRLVSTQELAHNRTRGGTGSIKHTPLVTNMMVMVRGDFLLAAIVTSVLYLPEALVLLFGNYYAQIFAYYASMINSLMHTYYAQNYARLLWLLPQ